MYPARRLEGWGSSGNVDSGSEIHDEGADDGHDQRPSLVGHAAVALLEFGDTTVYVGVGFGFAVVERREVCFEGCDPDGESGYGV